MYCFNEDKSKAASGAWTALTGGDSGVGAYYRVHMGVVTITCHNTEFKFVGTDSVNLGVMPEALRPTKDVYGSAYFIYDNSNVTVFKVGRAYIAKKTTPSASGNGIAWADFFDSSLIAKTGELDVTITYTVE